jgi:hypothetical protein
MEQYEQLAIKRPHIFAVKQISITPFMRDAKQVYDSLKQKH